MTTKPPAQRGGKRPGAGRPSVAASKRRVPVSVSMKPQQLDEVQSVVKPDNMSAYVGELIAADLAERRRARFGRVTEATIDTRRTSPSVRVVVPLDDVDLWTWAGWGVKSLDDIDATAVLVLECSSPETAQQTFKLVTAGVSS